MTAAQRVLRTRAIRQAPLPNTPPVASPLLCPFGVAETLSQHLDAPMFRFASRNRPMTHYIDRTEAQQ